jgi:DNA repair photolyase
MAEFKSFYKKVGGNEGDKCKHNTRLDTYGCGCEHDCKYCYAKSLLDFRGLWNPKNPAVADIDKIRRKVAKLPQELIRLGGMTDCFAPIELKHRVTYETIKALNERRIPYLIVTKSENVARDEYIKIYDKELAHIQVTITCFDDERYKALDYEKASLPSKRIAAVEKLQAKGFDVQIRLSPFIPEFVDYNRLNAIKCDKMVVEFLRVNTWVKRWFNIDYSPYTVKQGGYRHLPLQTKIDLIKNIQGKRITVCEDEDVAYLYWKNSFNPNKDDCCDLRG